MNLQIMRKKDVVRSRAPLRVSFGGGGTDVAPFSTQHGGCVLSTTIDRATYCTVRPRDDRTIRVHSRDLGLMADFGVGEKLAYGDQMDLAKVVLNHYDLPGGADILLHSDAPPGSGLGSSSALLVALISAMNEFTGTSMEPYEVAELAVLMERTELRIPGGVQDQYAAAFGGLNWMDFAAGGNVVTPIRASASVREELEYRSVLAYVGKTRVSANILNEQIEASAKPQSGTLDALHETKRLAHEMRRALLKGEWGVWGALLNEAWDQKKRFSSKVSDPTVDLLYREARGAGALGGKLLGAGGGGFLYLFCEAEQKPGVVAALRGAGAEPVGFAMDERGARAWRAKEG